MNAQTFWIVTHPGGDMMEINVNVDVDNGNSYFSSLIHYRHPDIELVLQESLDYLRKNEDD